ncbi:MAG: ester cyclase [Chloroflexi bacterium]|nr:ester cyclase [Chloroflexota bacterium]
MGEEIARFATDLVEAWNSHDVERLGALYTPDFEGVDVAQAAPLHGLEGIRLTFARYLRAFPDLHFTIDEAVVQGDRLALAWTARGTHRGPLLNIPATGRGVTVRGVSLLTVEGRRARRSIHIWDVAGLLRALGLLPDL